MPKGPNTSGKQPKSFTTDDKEAKKSSSKAKTESSYNKLIKAAVKLSSESETVEHRTKEGEKEIHKAPAKKMVLKHPKKERQSKTRSEREKSPSKKKNLPKVVIEKKVYQKK